MADTPAFSAEDAVIHGPGGGQHLWFLNNRFVVKAAGEVGGGIGAYESVQPPGSAPPLHVHHREDELFYVLEGVITFKCGDRVFTGEAGSFLLLPRDVPHTFIVEGDEPARALTILTPGAGIEFFKKFGRLPLHDGLPTPEPPDIPALVALAAEYGMEILGPPPTQLL